MRGFYGKKFYTGYRTHARRAERHSRELEHQVAARTRELAVLNEIAAAVSESLDLHKTLTIALEKTLQLLGIDGGGIYLLDEKSSSLKIAAQQGFTPEFIEKIDSLQSGEGFSGRVILSNEPLVIKDIAADPRLTRIAVVEAGIRSVVVVPLTSKRKVLGTLFVVTRGQREFHNREVELLASIGHQIGVAIDYALLYEDARNHLAQLSALQETNRAVVSTLDLDTLLNLIVQQAIALLQADGGILNLADWEKMEDQVVACAGSTIKFLGIPYPLTKSLSGWVTLNNQPVISNNLMEDPRVAQPYYEEFLGRRTGNAAVAPLAIKDHVIGSLVVVDKQGGNIEFNQNDLDLLVAFANQAATAIENARLYTEERRRAQQFWVIAEISRRLTLALDEEEMLGQVVRVIQQTLGYDHVGIGLIEGDELVYRVGSGKLWKNSNFQFSPARLKVGEEGIGGWVTATGKPFLVPDVNQEPRYVWMEGSATRSELVVPIFIKEKVIGVLDAQSDQLNAFDEMDLAVFQSLANQAGAAIENARLYKRAQQVAVMEERSRLARELHDAVTQTIFSASLLAEALPEVWENDPQEGRQVVQELRALSRGALAEMRTLLLELRPAALAETRLEDLLRQLGEAASGREGIPVTVTVERQGDMSLPEEVHNALYRIAQEALNNVVKHARASQASVRLCYSCLERDDPQLAPSLSVLLIIQDNGCGFDPAQVLHDHLGLGIMQERAEEIGASLTIDSRPGEGTQITVLWEEAMWKLRKRSGC